MDPTQIVQAQVEAFNARDLDRFVGCYAPDAVLEDGLGHVMAQGQEALRALYGQLFAQSPDLHVEVPQRITVGSHVIDEEEVTGFIFAGFPSEMHSAVVYRVEEERIARVSMLQ